jgi:uncharacterized protein
LLDNPQPITFAVFSDTHVPDRVRCLPDPILYGLAHAQVDEILHAGDAANWKVIRQLEQIAPVRVVQGNRDWLLGMPFPHAITFTALGVRITLTHGHHSMRHYLVDKWITLREGYRFERYYQQLAQSFPQSDVIIFGHTHYQTVQWVHQQLFFNPGAAYPCKYNQFTPQFGILSITPDGTIRTACY